MIYGESKWLKTYYHRKKGLTDSFLKHLKPQGKRYEINDPAKAGLRIRVNPTGKINFVWYYRDHDTSKNKVLTLGQYGAHDGQLSLKQARIALDTAKNKHINHEIDGNTRGKIPKTAEDLCEVFYTDRILPH